MNAYLAARNLRNGHYTIVAEYSHYPKVKKVATGVKVNAKYWDNTNKKVKANGAANVKKTNDDLAEVLKNLNDTVTELYKANGNVLPSVDQLNAHLSTSAVAVVTATTPETSLLSILNKYIATRTWKAVSTRKNFQTLANNVAAYEAATKRTWLLSNLTNQDIEEFHEWLLDAYSLSNSTAAKRNRLLKQFLTEFPAPRVNKSKVKAKYGQYLDTPQVLNKSEIEALIALPYDKNSRLGKVRNMAVLQIFTGLRYGDLIRLAPHHIKKGYVSIREEKTDVMRSFPLFTPAKAVLDMYTNEATGLFELPRISNQKFNKYLSEIVASMECLQEPVLITRLVRADIVETFEAKHLHITSHSSRRSFVSLLLSMNYTIRETMAFSGHKSLAAFQRYIGHAEARPNAVAEFDARWNGL